jgi:hypothetical protein
MRASPRPERYMLREYPTRDTFEPIKKEKEKKEKKVKPESPFLSMKKGSLGYLIWEATGKRKSELKKVLNKTLSSLTRIYRTESDLTTDDLVTLCQKYSLTLEQIFDAYKYTISLHAKTFCLSAENVSLPKNKISEYTLKEYLEFELGKQNNSLRKILKTTDMQSWRILRAYDNMTQHQVVTLCTKLKIPAMFLLLAYRKTLSDRVKNFKEKSILPANEILEGLNNNINTPQEKYMQNNKEEQCQQN